MKKVIIGVIAIAILLSINIALAEGKNGKPFVAFGDTIAYLQDQIDLFFDVFVKKEAHEQDIFYLQNQIFELNDRMNVMEDNQEQTIFNLQSQINNLDDRVSTLEDKDKIITCDEHNVEYSGYFTCGVGECRNKVKKCVDGILQTCVPGEPTTEICDGKDNDCNGLTDENFNVGESCIIESEECGTIESQYICKPDGTGTECEFASEINNGECPVIINPEPECDEEHGEGECVIEIIEL